MVAKALTMQYEPEVHIEVRTQFNVDCLQTIDKVIAEASQRAPCCFMYTLVSEEFRDYIREKLIAANLPGYDIMDPGLNMLTAMCGYKPVFHPGAKNRIDASYYERIEAIEFAVRYDDGKNPRGFLEADIVLLGVSRTSKTPLSMFLANRGLKVANLPLIFGAPIPEEVEQAEKGRIVGLTIDADKLLQIRIERLIELGIPPSAAYAQREQIDNELNAAADLFERLGCLVIDVSNMAIEETASRVIAHVAKTLTQ
jgi:hypothetical protein